MTSVSLGCWIDFHIRHNFPLVEQILSQIRELLDTAKYRTFRVILQCWSFLQIPGRTVSYFAFLETCLAPYFPMNVNPQGGAFLSVSAQGPLSSLSEVHGIFSSRNLPYTSKQGKQGQ